MTRIWFAAVPYVQVPRALSFGDWELWPNTATEWNARVGDDLCEFLKMYKAVDGKPLGERVSVLSRKDLSEPESGEWQRVIVGLSTVAWLDRARIADCWFYEEWDFSLDPATPKTDWTFVRHLKLINALSTAGQRQVLPPPDILTLRLDPFALEPLIDWLGDAVSRDRNRSTTRALEPLHRIRFSHPFYSSILWDIDAMWSAFEGLYDLSRLMPFKQIPWWYQVARRVPQLRKILRAPDRMSRDEYVVAEVREELTQCVQLGAGFWGGLEDWAAAAYKIRNACAHGGTLDGELLWMDAYDRHVLGVGIMLAEEILLIRSPLPKFLLADDIRRRLESIFGEKQTIEAVVELLRNSKRPDLYPGGAGKLTAIAPLLEKLVDLPAVTNRYRGSSRVASARKVMCLALSAWVVALLKAPPVGASLDAVKDVPGVIRALAGAGKTGDEIEGGLADALVARRAFDPGSYAVGGGAPSELLLDGLIPIWRWCDSLVRIQELYLGYELR